MRSVVERIECSCVCVVLAMIGEVKSTNSAFQDRLNF